MPDRIQDYQTIQNHIEMGHTYASITLALFYAKDAIQRADMEATLKALYESSGYIRSVVDHHPDPISALASRGNRDSEFLWGQLQTPKENGIRSDIPHPKNDRCELQVLQKAS